MNLHHQPADGAVEHRFARANDVVARAWWKPAACVSVIAVLGVVTVGYRGACEEIPDFEAFKDSDERKAMFIEYLVPRVQAANREVAQLRGRLLAINTAMDAGMAVGPVQRNFVMSVAKRHGLAEEPQVDRALMEQLLQRVDEVPVSLAVAQAAIESGWGTSRFTKEGNNLFGLRDYSSGSGLVPKERAAGESFGVAVYANPCAGVRAYIRNLNTHERYDELRALRQKLRAEGVPLSGERLTAGLHHYSERGDEYVELVRSLISYNDLGRFDEP